MIQSIPLKKLVPSPRNVRKSSDVLADLQLRADIAARGLLQNLVVRKGKRGKFEVEAGGRRLTALQALAEEGTLPDTHEVTCLVIEGEESEVREASLAENFQRLAMNPADEAQAFASIIEAGATTENVARHSKWPHLFPAHAAHLWCASAREDAGATEHNELAATQRRRREELCLGRAPRKMRRPRYRGNLV
jgi:ParB/RepB/Spo0J family partition protein